MCWTGISTVHRAFSVSKPTGNSPPELWNASVGTETVDLEMWQTQGRTLTQKPCRGGGASSARKKEGIDGFGQRYFQCCTLYECVMFVPSCIVGNPLVSEPCDASVRSQVNRPMMSCTCVCVSALTVPGRRVILQRGVVAFCVCV